MSADTEIRARTADVAKTHGVDSYKATLAAEVIVILNKHAAPVPRRGKKAPVAVTMTRAQWEWIYKMIAGSSDPRPISIKLARAISDTLWPMPECNACDYAAQEEPF